MNRLLPFAFLFAASMAWGQVSSPLLGYLPDGLHIRPVNGIPAAAAVEPILELKQDFAQSVASPAHDYALVTDNKQAKVSVYTPAQGLTPLLGANAAPRLMVTSPRGSAAVLWSSQNHAQLITGLPGSPVIRQINAAFLLTQPSSLAISDDGKWLAGAFSTGLYLWGPFGQVTQLPMQESVSAIAFFQGSPDLAVAVPQRVLKFKAADGFIAASALYNAGDDWQPDVAALAVSPDNSRVILADRTGWIVSVDAASGSAVKVTCSCQPEGLFGMGQSSFRLTGLANGAFQLFDAVHNEVLFAPLALAEGDKQ